jgi:transposase
VVVTSGGFKSGNLKHLGNDLYRLRKAQRRLSRKEKGSQNWKKQKRRVARLHARIADRRNDLLHTLSRKLVDENQTICLETLNVKGMQRREASAASVQNRSVSRSIADTGWSTLVQYIEYFATSNTKPNGLAWSRSTGGFRPRSGAPDAGTSERPSRCRFGAGNVKNAVSIMIGM